MAIGKYDLTPAQCRMARAALRIGIRELAIMAGTSAPTVCRFENGRRVYWGIVDALQAALEQAGVEFMPEGDETGAGVRLKQG